MNAVNRSVSPDGRIAGRVARAAAWLSVDDAEHAGSAGTHRVPARAGGSRGLLVTAGLALTQRAQAARSRASLLARSHPAVADTVLAVAMLGVGLMAATQGVHHTGPATWAFAVAVVVPIIWRRRYPAGVFTVTFAAAVAGWSVAELLAARVLDGYVLLVCLYTVARHSPRRVAVVAAGTLEAGVAGITLGGGWIQSFVYVTGLVAAAFLLGSSLRNRHEYLAALVERARRLEIERDQQARIAAAAERANIAREMHDIVAHSLAVIITMADAAGAKRRSDPERAGAAMEQVAETARQALGETRRLLGVLHTDRAGSGNAPLPGLAQLDALLAQVRATGLRAELTVTGQRFMVPESAQIAAYRIVQEALTNSIRHATGATSVRVRLRYAEPVIEIEAADDGKPQAAAQSDGMTCGHGLAGMSERAALYDGTVTAGRLPDSGWGVSARLRVAGSVAGPPLPEVDLADSPLMSARP